MIAAMREARLEPPRFHDTRNYFRVTFKNNTLMTPEALRWLNQFAGHPLNDNQRMALVYLRDNERMTNSDYRRLNNVYDTAQATRELRELVETGLVRMHGTRRWAYYTLAPDIAMEVAPPPATEYTALGLNDRQIKAMRYLQEHGEITTIIYCREIAPQISERTARKDLNDLVERGLITRIGRTRGTKYVLLSSE